MRRAVLYARVSSDDRGKDGRNLDSQLEMGRDYAEQQGYQVVAKVAEDDKGASGASFELPGLKRVLHMAEAGQFDTLIARDMDRLSRDLLKQLQVEEALDRAEVEIKYVLADYPDTAEGELSKIIRGTIAQFERRKITERMVRGRFNKVRAGHVLVHGLPPYGYRVAEVDGKHALVVYEPEAKVVRMVFDWYTKDGLSIAAITRKLTELKIPTYADTHGRIKKQRGYGVWGRSVVHTLLKNEVYVGKWRYGKRNNSKGKWRNSADDHVLTVEVPAIVSVEQFEAVKARSVENGRNSKRNMRHEYLMARRAVCGSCGLKMNGKTTISRGRTFRYYRCPAASGSLDSARQCDAPYFRVDLVDAAVWGWAKELLTDPGALEHGLEQYQADGRQEHEPLAQRLAVVDGLLTDNRRKLERLLDLYLEGDFDRGLLAERKAKIERTMTSLQDERADLAAKLAAVKTLSIEQAANLQAFVAKVATGLDVAEADFETRRKVIEALNMTATLAVEEGQQVAYVSFLLDKKAYQLSPREPVL